MSAPEEWLQVESLDLDGQGVAHDSTGKVCFIDGALPGERVQVSVVRRKAHWEQAVVATIARESALRVSPRCPHFGLHAGACGGCKLQHLDAAAQVAIKQRVLEDTLWHLGQVRPDRVLRPIEGPAWHYRARARLSVRYVTKKASVLVGFHERKSSYVADMTSCCVLPRKVSDLLLPLRDLIATMDARDRLPQIEVAVGDATLVFVLRHLEPLSAGDFDRLRRFGAEHGVQWWLQPAGPESACRLGGDGTPALAYALPEFGITIPFGPTDFTQVNPDVNRALVGRTVRLLELGPHDRVIDWFCGLGNFTLPIASRATDVLGIEGSPVLIERARANAAVNGLGQRARFEVCDLFKVDANDLQRWGAADRWLVDPPREGAFALAKALVAQRELSPQWPAPARIVYVSCNPATLARDAALLVKQAGYRCAAAGIVNMFPHTAHVESIAVFDRG